MNDRVSAAATRLREADSAVGSTEAGLSTASSILDFRSDGGILEQYDPMAFHVCRFKRDPDGFWEDRAAMVAEVYDSHEPNRAHEALAALKADSYLDRAVTQNVDGLHRDAGSGLVVVNPEETPADGRTEFAFRADVTDVLPAMCDVLVEAEI